MLSSTNSNMDDSSKMTTTIHKARTIDAKVWQRN